MLCPKLRDDAHLARHPEKMGVGATQLQSRSGHVCSPASVPAVGHVDIFVDCNRKYLYDAPTAAGLSTDIYGMRYSVFEHQACVSGRRSGS